MKRYCAVLLAIMTSLLASGARAQSDVSPLAPVVKPLFSDSVAAATADRDELWSYVASTPLRMTLTRGVLPQSHFYPNCASYGDASGNSLGGYAVQRYTFLRVVPDIVVHGFSSAGCPVDSGVGGGITYSASLANDSWLVFGAGIYALPDPLTLRDDVITSLRLDFVERLRSDLYLTVGVGMRQSRFEKLQTTLDIGVSF